MSRYSTRYSSRSESVSPTHFPYRVQWYISNSKIHRHGVSVNPYVSVCPSLSCMSYNFRAEGRGDLVIRLNWMYRCTNGLYPKGKGPIEFGYPSLYLSVYLSVIACLYGLERLNGRSQRWAIGSIQRSWYKEVSLSEIGKLPVANFVRIANNSDCSKVRLGV